jgi:hypothetical protein
MKKKTIKKKKVIYFNLKLEPKSILKAKNAKRKADLEEDDFNADDISIDETESEENPHGFVDPNRFFFEFN